MRYALILAFFFAGSLPAQARDSLIEVKQNDSTHKVFITDIVHNNIDFFFFAIAERANLEAVFCVAGKHDEVKSETVMSELQFAWIDSAGANQLAFRSGRCDKEGVIGTVHFHPGGGACGLSVDDIYSANVHPWPIMAIVCQEKKGDRPNIVVVSRQRFANDRQMLDRGELVAKYNAKSATVYRYRKP